MYQIKHIVIKDHCRGEPDTFNGKLPWNLVTVTPSLPAIHYWGSTNIPLAVGDCGEGFVHQEIPYISSVEAKPTFDHFIHLDLHMSGTPDEKNDGFIIFFESDITFLRTNGKRLFDLYNDSWRKAVLLLEEGQYLECKNIRFEVNDGLFVARNVSK